MPICGIYAIENLVNGKIYIGQSVDINKRFREHKHHLGSSNHCNRYLQSAWNKYGSANFTFKILEDCSESKLNEKEIFYILKYRQMTEVYNLCDGGYGIRGYTHTKETRAKLSIASKGNASHKGVPHSEKTKKKLSKINKGKKIPRKVVAKSVETRKGYRHSEETRRKLSNSLKGNTNPKGVKRSEDAKRKLAEIRRGQNSTSAKLRDEQVYIIKELLSQGVRNRLIAETFNISPSVVCDIKHGRTWGHIIIDGVRRDKGALK